MRSDGQNQEETIEDNYTLLSNVFIRSY